MSIDTLRTQVHNLQWEVNQLDVENRKLRSNNEEAASRVDLESELEQMKHDVVTFMEQLELCRRRAEENELRATQAEHRIVETERQLENSEQIAEEQRKRKKPRKR